MLLDFNTYCKATVTLDWQKKRQIDQWNRIEIPLIDSHKYSQLTFDRTAKADS